MKKIVIFIGAMLFIIGTHLNGLAGGSDEIRDSYEKYLQSYEEFKTATEKGASADQLKLAAEKYREASSQYNEMLGKHNIGKYKEAGPANNIKISTDAGYVEAAAASKSAANNKSQDEIFIQAGAAIDLKDEIAISLYCQQLKEIAATSSDVETVIKAKRLLARAELEFYNDDAEAEKLYKEIAALKPDAQPVANAVSSYKETFIQAGAAIDLKDEVAVSIYCKELKDIAAKSSSKESVIQAKLLLARAELECYNNPSEAKKLLNEIAALKPSPKQSEEVKMLMNKIQSNSSSQLPSQPSAGASHNTTLKGYAIKFIESIRKLFSINNRVRQ